MQTRIRTVKPELARHEVLFDLEKELQLPIRFAWVMMFTCCDREGRFKWKPRVIKAMILPYDDVDMSRVLDAWASRGLVVRYAIQGEEYGYIPSWKKHQSINNREPQSEIPAPNQQLDATTTRQARDTNAIDTKIKRVDDAFSDPLSYARAEGKGRELEGKGREDKSAPVSNHSTPDGMRPEQYARGFLETLQIPVTPSNLQSVRAAIEAHAGAAKDYRLAHDELLEATKAAIEAGEPVNRFFFEDANKYKKYLHVKPKAPKRDIAALMDRQRRGDATAYE